MKLIVRADDLGISQGVNYGIYKAVTDGIVTAVGLMPNMEAARHGYTLLAKSKVCLGQHTNISLGKPVCDPALIPSLVDANGDFHSSGTIAKRKSDTIVIEECEKEIEAQLQRFVDITGQTP